MKKDNRNRRVKTGALVYTVLLIVFGLGSLITEAIDEGGMGGGAGSLLALLVVIVVIAGIVYGIVKLARSRALRKAALSGDSKAAREAELHAAHARRRAQEAREEIRTYSAENYDPDEYYRQRRLEMIDGFLKNGLIEKDEYRIMKERYENM